MLPPGFGLVDLLVKAVRLIADGIMSAAPPRKVARHRRKPPLIGNHAVRNLCGELVERRIHSGEY